MTVEELNSRIAVVNAESKRLNNERQINIGKRETLSTQLAESLAHYNKTYNTNITLDTLQAEIDRVTQLKEKEIQNIEKMLELIKLGNYAEATALAGGVNVPQEQESTKVDNTSTQPVIEQPVVQPTAPIIEQPVVAPSNPNPVPPVITPPTMETPVAPVPPVIKPTAPAAPPSLSGLDLTPVTPPVASAPNTQVVPPLATPSLSGLDVSPVAPPPVTPQKPVTSFEAILGGAYNPQQN